LINTLKAEVPIWKEQHFASGDAEWVGLGDEDVAARQPEGAVRSP
jgi:molybdopterin synthase catalytic subunit